MAMFWELFEKNGNIVGWTNVQFWKLGQTYAGTLLMFRSFLFSVLSSQWSSFPDGRLRTHLNLYIFWKFLLPSPNGLSPSAHHPQTLVLTPGVVSLLLRWWLLQSTSTTASHRPFWAGSILSPSLAPPIASGCPVQLLSILDFSVWFQYQL